MYDTDGLQVGADVTLNPGPRQWIQQQDIFDAAGIGESEAAYTKVLVETAGGTIWAYASVVDNDTNDPTTIPVIAQ